MHPSTILSLLILPLISAVSAAPAASPTPSVITTKKITPAYWRATFSDPPLNIQADAFFADFYALADQITSDPDVKVVVFDSASKSFFSNHVDLVGSLNQTLWPGAPRYWDAIARLANAPVLTIAAIRGIAQNAGAEVAAVLDVRFASRERAVFVQGEVGFGGNPGGGGIEMLARLVGRSRALEIVLGADRLDADTAALYGWINRAIPDAQFEKFVDQYARRVAGWDHFAIAAAKKLINGRTGFPTAEQQQESFNSFLADVAQGSVAARLKALAAAGLQTSEKFEVRLPDEELKYVGEGPWKA